MGALRVVLLLWFAVSSKCEKLVELPLTNVPFQTARAGLMNGLLHQANNYGTVSVSRKSATCHVNEFKHPRGGRTVEHCTVLTDKKNSLFEMQIDAASPTAPFGEQFQTRVLVTLEQKPKKKLILRARSRVHWLKSRRPTGFISSRVEKAAEQGATEAYNVLARCLIDTELASPDSIPGKIAHKAQKNKKKTFALALGAVVAWLQYHSEDAVPHPDDDG